MQVVPPPPPAPLVEGGSPAERVLLAVRDPYAPSSVSVYCAARTGSGYVVGDAAHTFRGATIVLDADDAIVSESYAVGSSGHWDKKANNALVVREGYTRYRFVRADEHRPSNPLVCALVYDSRIDTAWR